MAVALRIVPDLLLEHGLESPFRLGAQCIGLGCCPAPHRRMRLLEKGGYSRPAVEVLFRSRSAERPHLEDITIGKLGRRPRERAIDDADRRPGLEAFVHENLVSVRQPKVLQTEIRHEMHHEPVLARIMHMMQLHVRMRGKEAQGQRAHSLELRCDVVWIEPPMGDRHEISLRQPWNTASGTQMHERAIG